MAGFLRFLSSLRLGIVLIALVTVACIVGSIVGSDANMGIDFAQEHVFHTWWFLGLMGLLLVNLTLCSWEKSYIALTLYRKRSFATGTDFFSKATHSATVSPAPTPDAVDERLRATYSVTRRRGNVWYAQRGLLGRCGATIIHIGLLWTMLAGGFRILADDLGIGVFDSTVVLPEGESHSVYFQRIDRLKGNSVDNLRQRQMPFTLRNLDFRADYHPNSSVARYYSTLIELRDGDYSKIVEVNMTHPLVYKGFKVTQNSFSDSDRIRRGHYRIVDTRTGLATEVDAGPGDPVRTRLPGSDHLFLQVEHLGADAPFNIVDLAASRVVASGLVRAEARPISGAEMGAIERQLQSSRYALLVTALFPNFRIDESGKPTTADDEFSNPAALVMFFKNGKANGAQWVFRNPGAQEIIGQPHPEVSVSFADYRTTGSSSSDLGIMDYEISLHVAQKDPATTIGEFWVTPGTLLELPGISDTILNSPATMPVPPAAAEAHTHDDAPTTGAFQDTGGAGPGSAEGGDAARYEVTWIGTRLGHVSFLGFMKDPSVLWMYAGCIIILIGAMMAFLIPYRETWAMIDPETGILHLATRVRGTSPGAHREFDRLARSLISSETEASRG